MSRSATRPHFTLLRVIIEGAVLFHLLFAGFFLSAIVAIDHLGLEAGFSTIFLLPLLFVTIVGAQRWRTVARTQRLAHYFTRRDEGIEPVGLETEFGVAEIVAYEKRYRDWRAADAQETERGRSELEQALARQGLDRP
jgi:hypothetical protein